VYPCFYQEDARTGFRYAAGAEARVAGHFEIDSLARLNSLGFHDDEPLPPGRSAWRILAVGDVSTCPGRRSGPRCSSGSCAPGARPRRTW
jgi:hypothetical protein